MPTEAERRAAAQLARDCNLIGEEDAWAWMKETTMLPSQIMRVAFKYKLALSAAEEERDRLKAESCARLMSLDGVEAYLQDRVYEFRDSELLWPFKKTLEVVQGHIACLSRDTEQIRAADDHRNQVALTAAANAEERLRLAKELLDTMYDATGKITPEWLLKRARFLAEKEG